MKEENILMPRSPISVLDYEDPADHFGSQEEDSLRPFEVCDPSGNASAPIGALRVGDTQSVQTDQLHVFSEVAHNDEVGNDPTRAEGCVTRCSPLGMAAWPQFCRRNPPGRVVDCNLHCPIWVMMRSGQHPRPGMTASCVPRRSLRGMAARPTCCLVPQKKQCYPKEEHRPVLF